MREQDDWDEHAKFMEDLVDTGFLVLGGPLEGENGREVLHIVDAESEDTVHARFADDIWTKTGMLKTVRVESWTILLDGRRQGR